LHLAAFLAAIGGIVVMLLLAHDARGYIGASIFGASLIVVYGTSAAYHRIPWSERMSGIMRRIDHAMIFFIISGTYTPFCLIALEWRDQLLSSRRRLQRRRCARLAWLNCRDGWRIAYLATAGPIAHRRYCSLDARWRCCCWGA
jgi:hypothetical protein